MFLFCSNAYADYKFHFGDKVKIHSTAWKKSCYEDEFYNFCGKVGIVVDVMDYAYDSGKTKVYDVKFEIKGAPPIIKRYHEVHLRRVK